MLWAEKYYVQKEDMGKIIYIDQRMLDAGVDDKEAMRLHMNMAVVYAKLGKKEKAIEHAQAIARLDPAQKRLWITLLTRFDAFELYVFRSLNLDTLNS